MYNVILTANDTNKQYYVSSDGRTTPFYFGNDAIKFEFEDYEDANNVVIDFISQYSYEYRNDLFEIEVVQM